MEYFAHDITQYSCTVCLIATKQKGDLLVQTAVYTISRTVVHAQNSKFLPVLGLH